MRARRVAALVIATAFLLGTGFIGLRNGITEWGGAVSFSEKSVTAGVFLYGLLGLAAGVGLLLRRMWSYGVVLAWVVVVTAVAGGAVRIYGEGSIGDTAIAAIASFAVAALVAWLVRYVLVANRD